MKDDRVRYFAENMDRLSRRDRILINNPVIMQGLGLATVVIPATSIQNAVVLAAAVLMLLTPTRMIATFIGQRVGFKMRAVVYVLTSGVVFAGVAYAIDLLFGSQAAAVGIYLPLLTVEPLILKRYESPKRERLITSFKKGVVTSLGYCLVLFLVAALREILATGRLAGIELYTGSLLPMMAMPAGGFILLGLIVAVWRAVVNSFKQKIYAEVEHIS